jgi:hypothetical protein
MFAGLYCLEVFLFLLSHTSLKATVFYRDTTYAILSMTL